MPTLKIEIEISDRSYDSKQSPWGENVAKILDSIAAQLRHNHIMPILKNDVRHLMDVDGDDCGKLELVDY